MKTMKALATIAAIGALAAAIAPSTLAYTTYGKWGTLNVAFYVNPVNADVSQNAAISALQAGMSAWNTESGTSFRFSYAGQTSSTTTGNDGKNVILFRNTSNGSTIGTTYAWSSGGVLVDSDIILWDGGWKFFTGSSGCDSGAYIEDIAAHELGHSLGLNHSSVAGATMAPQYDRCSTGMRTLSSDDIAGAKALYANGAGAVDSPPTVSVLSPVNGAQAKTGTPVAFSGSAMDTPDGDISSKLVWKSNLDGQIGTGASFSKALTAGNHTVTATVKDSIGYTISKAIMVYVTTSTTNTAPTVTISTPTNGAVVPAGTSVTFSGSASDSQDGSLTGSVTWRSNIDGQIGTGGSFSRTLSSGTHTITASVSDSGGLTGQKSISVSVGSTSTSTSPSLSVRAYKEKGLQKADLTWRNLTASTVDIYRGGSKISTTANDGSMTDAIDKKGAGSYSYKVCAAGTTTCTNSATASF
jgi:hypothetical protein